MGQPSPGLLALLPLLLLLLSGASEAQASTSNVTEAAALREQASTSNATESGALVDLASVGNATETAALLEFKAALVNSSAIADWDAATDLCSWTGVTCNPSGHVSEL